MSLASRIIISLLMILSIAGCKSENTPTGTVKKFLSIKFNGPSNLDKVMELFSEESLDFAGKNNNISREQLKDIVKKQMESEQFQGMKFIDLREASLKEYDEKTKILIAEVKYKPSKEKEVTTIQNEYVLVNENGKWKISFNNFIKTISLNNSCGEKNNVQICLDRAVITASNVVVFGKVSNNSKSTYMYGFSSPTITTIKSDKGETFSSNHPNFELSVSSSNHANFLQNSEEMKTLRPGTKNEVFIFGSGAEKVLMTGKPTEFIADKIMKTAWGGMPSLGDNGFSINVKIK